MADRNCSHDQQECPSCFRERLLSVGLSKAATPTRKTGSAPPSKADNSWERGVPRDERGVPFLDHNGGVCFQKEVVENRDRWRKTERNRVEVTSP